MTSEEHAALLRQQEIDRAGEAWEVTEREIEQMANDYYHEEGQPMEAETALRREVLRHYIRSGQMSLAVLWYSRHCCRCEGALTEQDWERNDCPHCGGCLDPFSA